MSVHESSAAYVLGALSPEERRTFEVHLETCRRCQNSLVEFAPLPGLLSAADPSEPRLEIDVESATISAALAGDRATRRSRGRWRLLAGAALAAAAALLALLVVNRGDPAPFFDGPISELVVDSSEGITGSMSVSERPWGSRLDIDLFDVPERDAYQLWAVGTDGSWDAAASWAFAETGTCRIAGATRFQPGGIDHLVVTSADPADVLVRSG